MIAILLVGTHGFAFRQCSLRTEDRPIPRAVPLCCAAARVGNRVQITEGARMSEDAGGAFDLARRVLRSVYACADGCRVEYTLVFPSASKASTS